MKVGEKGENLGRPSLRKNLMKSQTHFKNIVPKREVYGRKWKNLLVLKYDMNPLDAHGP